MSTRPDHHRPVDCEYRRIPDGCVLPDTRIDEAERALLSCCGRFRTLEDHTARICSSLEVGPDSLENVRAVVERLATEGWLVSDAEFLLRLSDPMAVPDTECEIDTIGFVTRDRPKTLLRAVRSYAEHANRHGRKPRFVVVDDSSRSGLHDELRELAGTLGIPIAYAGLKQKERFKLLLGRRAGVSPETLDFAFSDPLATGQPYGASRNLLLAETSGTPFLSADDDTICRVVTPPERRRLLTLSSGRPPIEFWFYPDLETGLRELRPREEDLLGILGGVLGRSIPSLVNEFSPAVDLERLGDNLFENLWARTGRVISVMPGMLGDSGVASPVFHVLDARGASRRRLLHSESGYRMATTSRDYLRAVTSPTVNDGAYFMATAVALDGRCTLPPFLPVFRCEDNLYGPLLRHCFPNHYPAHLPEALVHAPAEARRYSPESVEEAGLSLPAAVVIELCMQEVAGKGGSAEKRMEDLGKHLVTLGDWPAEDFDGYLGQRLESWTNRELATVTRVRNTYGRGPDFWDADVERYERALTRRFESGTEAFLEIRGADAIQRILTRYGQLLRCWPAILDAARELRELGHGLARPGAP